MGLDAESGGAGGPKEKEKEEKKEEKFALCESIGHRPLRGRCPKRIKQKDRPKKIGREFVRVVKLTKMFNISTLILCSCLPSLCFIFHTSVGRLFGEGIIVTKLLNLLEGSFISILHLFAECSGCVLATQQPAMSIDTLIYLFICPSVFASLPLLTAQVSDYLISPMIQTSRT